MKWPMSSEAFSLPPAKARFTVSMMTRPTGIESVRAIARAVAITRRTSARGSRRSIGKETTARGKSAHLDGGPSRRRCGW